MTTTLYRLFDKEEALLYVGIADNWPRRMQQHSKEKDWFPLVSKVTSEFFATRAEAEAAEREAIISESPAHNVMHNRGHGRLSKWTWRCDFCGLAMRTTGFLQITRTERQNSKTTGQDMHWIACHAHCDPEPEDYFYLIHCDMICDGGDFDRWCDHLNEKPWIDNTDWWSITDRLMGA